VNDGPDALLADVPRASFAQSTAAPWGGDPTNGITFHLHDSQERPLTEGRVGLDSAYRRHLRWWPMPGSIAYLLDQERKAGLN